MQSITAISIEGVSHWYGDHRALNHVDFAVSAGEIFGLLGPNGGGKTTLFRILSTLLPVQQGTISLLGLNVQSQPDEVRCCIGVTFQSPSLDPKLSVSENLKYQAMLYGLHGRVLKSRVSELLDRLGLSDRSRDRVESLSGGLKRRVEIAKGLLHNPQVLLLDEPSSGLDPGARHDLWKSLDQLRTASGVTVLVTTHLMEEAERCDRLGILDQGNLVALDSPENLRASIGGDCLTIHSDHPDLLADQISKRFGVMPQHVGETLRIERSNGHELLRDVVAAFPDEITSVLLGKPTLEDVFIARTGHRFWVADSESDGKTATGTELDRRPS